jgi:hypothetical protein
MTQYQCGCCGNQFNSDTSTDEAMTEFYNRFPKGNIQEANIICDICYQRFWAWYETNQLSLPLEQPQ